MRDQVYLSKEEYIEILKAIDIMVCILDRSEKRDDVDNRAYSLAIACAETDMAVRLTGARKLLLELISADEYSEIDDAGIFEEYEVPQMPYDSGLHELRGRLTPYLVKYSRYKEDTSR